MRLHWLRRAGKTSLSLSLSGPSLPPPPAHCAVGWSVTAPLLPQDTLWLLQAQEQGQRCGNLTNFGNSCSLLTPTMHVLLYTLTAKTCTTHLRAVHTGLLDGWAHWGRTLSELLHLSSTHTHTHIHTHTHTHSSAALCRRARGEGGLSDGCIPRRLSSPFVKITS